MYCENEKTGQETPVTWDELIVLQGSEEKKEEIKEGGYINRTLLEKKFGNKSNRAGWPEKIIGLFPVSPLIIEDLPGGNIKLDFNTTLENIFGMAYASALCVLAVTGFFILYSGWEKCGLYLFLSFIAFIISIIFHLGTDNYYFIDIQQKALIYHFQFWFIKMDFRKILISQIAATSIDYSYRIKYDEYKKFHLRREYFIVFLTRNGRKIKISNWYREYTECLQIAMEIAEKLNIEFRQNSKAGVM